MSSIISPTTETATYRENISSSLETGMLFKKDLASYHQQYTNRIISHFISSSESIYLYEHLFSEKEYEITDDFYQLPENIRKLAFEIVDYLKYEWDTGHVIKTLHLSPDKELSEQAQITLIFKESTVEERSLIFDKLLSAVFNKFKDHSEIWDITIIYR